MYCSIFSYDIIFFKPLWMFCFTLHNIEQELFYITMITRIILLPFPKLHLINHINLHFIATTKELCMIHLLFNANIIADSNVSVDFLWISLCLAKRYHTHFQTPFCTRTSQSTLRGNTTSCTLNKLSSKGWSTTTP